ncbi:MAG: F0F1 ATP synthase subunit B [Gammaproteobacteria bacterium]|nr:F0F1 ATP synthase subunit B [Gammaproteobacteria bacterium]
MTLNLTLIGQSITFLVFVWTCWKFIWPPLMNAMQERQKAIGEGLAAAERAEKDLQLARERATDNLREAKEEAAKILDQARGQANQMIENAKNDARAEGERLKEAQRAEIEQEVNRAKETLRKQVAVLAVTGAERVLGASVDADRHGELLDKIAAEL